MQRPHGLHLKVLWCLGGRENANHELIHVL